MGKTLVPHTSGHAGGANRCARPQAANWYPRSAACSLVWGTCSHASGRDNDHEHPLPPQHAERRCPTRTRETRRPHICANSQVSSSLRLRSFTGRPTHTRISSATTASSRTDAAGRISSASSSSHPRAPTHVTCQRGPMSSIRTYTRSGTRRTLPPQRSAPARRSPAGPPRNCGLPRSRGSSPSAGTTPRSRAGTAPRSRAGTTPRSRAGTTPRSRAGTAPRSRAGTTPRSRAGTTPRSRAGTTPRSRAGTTPRSRAGTTPRSCSPTGIWPRAASAW